MSAVITGMWLIINQQDNVLIRIEILVNYLMKYSWLPTGQLQLPTDHS